MCVVYGWCTRVVYVLHIAVYGGYVLLMYVDYWMCVVCVCAVCVLLVCRCVCVYAMCMLGVCALIVC